ncbi:hypothetical protein EK904_005655, partial [Melospiza melodia maxima]
RNRLEMFNDPIYKTRVNVKGSKEIPDHNKNEAYQILEKGAAKKSIAATYMNAYSITQADEQELVGTGNIDLHEVKTLQLIKEFMKLEIPKNKKDFSNRRVCPTSMNPKGKQSTVEYAHRAKNVMKPSVNQQLPKGAAIEEDTEEIKHLKGDLCCTRPLKGKLKVWEEQVIEDIEIMSTMEKVCLKMCNKIGLCYLLVKLSHSVKLTEKQISGSAGALNIMTAMVEIVLGLNCLFQNNIRKFSDAKYYGNLGVVKMEKCVYTKNANELVFSLQSQLNLLAQEMQNSSLYTAKKCKFDDCHHCWARKCLSANY